MNRFSPDTLRRYCADVMTASGVDAACAGTVADVLVDADLTGVATHGVSRMAIYMQRMEAGVVSRKNEIRVLRESPSALAIDAGNTLGAPSTKFAMERCMEKAAQTGCCFATVRNSNHFGAAAYYTRLAAAKTWWALPAPTSPGRSPPMAVPNPIWARTPFR